MKISIIMCSLNSMPYIMASVESFKKQNYRNKELIIICSKSNDKTNEYLKSINDKNINVYNFEGNIYASLNFGVKKAKGNIVGILHSEDIFFNKNVLSHVIEKFKKKNADVVYGNIVYSDKNNLTIHKRTWTNISLDKKYDLPPHTGVFLKKKILYKNKYNTNYSICSDTDLLLKIFKENYKISYLKRYICIMRMGGLSTNIFSFIKKTKEDLKIYYKNNLTIIDYFQKVLSKTKQLFYTNSCAINKYHIDLNNVSKVKFINFSNFLNSSGKIISALNLAFVAYDYKYKIRAHNYVFWPDGIFSSIVTKKKKIPGRQTFLKILNQINKRKKIKILVYGNLPMISKIWLEKNLSKKFEHISLPYDEAENIYKKIKKNKFVKKTLIILTLPTPKQEILANLIIKDFPDLNILCIGGSINMLSGYEKKAPNLLYKLNLEWLWRLKFDSRRRFLRLLESLKLIFKLYISGKNKVY